MIRPTGQETARALCAAPAAPAGGARRSRRGRGCGLVRFSPIRSVLSACPAAPARRAAPDLLGLRLAAPVLLAVLLAALLAAPARAETTPPDSPQAAEIARGDIEGGEVYTVAVPSGQRVELHEVLIDDANGESLLRFRFVAPRIGRDAGDIGYDVSAIDMDHLCNNLVPAYLAEFGLSHTRVVISLADRAVPFGATDPEATQFFEIYRLEGDRCIWEEY